MSEVWKNSGPALRDFLFWLQKKKVAPSIKSAVTEEQAPSCLPFSWGITKKTIAEGWASFL